MLKILEHDALANRSPHAPIARRSHEPTWYLGRVGSPYFATGHTGMLHVELAAEGFTYRKADDPLTRCQIGRAEMK